MLWSMEGSRSLQVFPVKVIEVAEVKSQEASQRVTMVEDLWPRFQGSSLSRYQREQATRHERVIGGMKCVQRATQRSGEVNTSGEAGASGDSQLRTGVPFPSVSPCTPIISWGRVSGGETLGRERQLS